MIFIASYKKTIDFSQQSQHYSFVCTLSGLQSSCGCF